MKISKLIELLSSASEEFIAIELDGQLYDIIPELGHEEETFDGFATSFPAMSLLRINNSERAWEDEQNY